VRRGSLRNGAAHSHDRLSFAVVGRVGGRTESAIALVSLTVRPTRNRRLSTKRFRRGGALPVSYWRTTERQLG